MLPYSETWISLHYISLFSVMIRNSIRNSIRIGIRYQSTISINPNILDLRIGLITDIKRHENADSLYVSQIRLQGEEIKQVCSGLVGLVSIEELSNRRVIVVNNLKPSKMRGIKSEAMLLCADGGEGKVYPVIPPKDMEIGSVLEFDGVDKVEVKKRIKSKVFESVSEELKLNDKWQVVWKDCLLANGECVAGVGDEGYIGAVVR